MPLKTLLVLGIFLIIASSLLLLSPMDAGAAPGPVGLWTFDEGSGTTVGDSSGNGNNGTWEGTLGSQWISGKYGTGGNFNGIDNYVDLPNSSSLKSNDGTFSVWVKTTNDNDEAIYAATQGSSSQGITIELGPSSDQCNDELITVFTNGIDDVCLTTTNRNLLFDGNWHHIEVTQGTETIIYLDGITYPLTKPYSGSDPAQFTSNALIDTFRVGNQRVGSANVNYFNGQMDDVRIYDYARTPAEIIDDMNNVQPTPSPTPTPTSTPGPSSGGASSDSSTPVANSNSGPVNCNDTIPASAPDLYEIDAAGTFTNLYFVGSKAPVTGYNINYGLDRNANQYGDNYKSSDRDWITSRAIHQLAPNTIYYFKVQGVNGCNAGPWSQTVKVRTKNRMADIIGLINKLNPLAKKPTPRIVVLTPITECSYQVKFGDSLWLIAKRKFGTGTKYPEIVTLNPGLVPTSILPIGKALTLCQ